MSVATAALSQPSVRIGTGSSITASSNSTASQRLSVACPQFDGLRRADLCISGSPGGHRQNGFAHLQEMTSGLHSRITAMAGTGKFFVGGNWKCNGNQESVGKLILELNEATLEDEVDVIVAPPFVYLDQVVRSLNSRIEVSAQNCWVGKGGAFTGEISAEMLTDIGVGWVILGHSERRHILGESNEFVGKKEAYALSQNLKVIGCVGELLEEREAGKTFEVIFAQLKAMADHVPSWVNVVVAYEPVWAIGTGKVASPEQAQEVHSAIRKWLAENVSPEVASQTRIIYGGSVNAANSTDLAKQEDIDGFLVGGASLKGPEFANICNSVTAKKVAV